MTAANRKTGRLRPPVKIILIAALFGVVLLGIAAACFLAYINPPEDDVDSFDYPPEFFCKTEENRIDRQKDGKCAAYACAYLLRHMGEDVNGEEVYPEIGRTFGFVTADSVADVFRRRGYQAKACYGDVDTLKHQLASGYLIIVFVRIPGDTHYAVVVGYDEQYVYLADSLAENTNVSDARYNRVLTTKEFEDIWKNGTLLKDNIYIVVRI